MRIIRESRLRKMLKEAYEKELNIRCDICWRAMQGIGSKRGIILSGYDLDKDLEEILKRKGCN